jgi:glucan-binding YG repeat protein
METRTIERGRSLAAGAALALGLVLACLLGTAVQAQAAPVPDDGALPAVEEVQATGKIVIDEPAAPAPPAPEAAAPAEEPAAPVAPAPAEEPAVPAEEPAAPEAQATGKVAVDEPAAPAPAPVAPAPAPAAPETAPVQAAAPADESAPLETFAAAKKGWQKEHGTWYYYGAKQAQYTGFKKIEGKYYFFSQYGSMSSDQWQNVNGYWYYFKPVKDGKAPALANGLKKLDTYSREAVVYKKGKQTTEKYVDGTYYLFDAAARMKTGLQKVGKSSYYFDAAGRMQDGFVTIQGKRYRFLDTTIHGNGPAKLVTKLTARPYYVFEAKTVPNEVKRYTWYLSSAKGEVYTGWKTIAGKRYFFSEGVMAQGSYVIEGKHYYFAGGLNTADGKSPLITRLTQTKSTWLNEYYISTDKKGNDRYYRRVSVSYNWVNAGSDGVLQSGWLTQGRNRYYFSEGEWDYGVMAQGLTYIDGKDYYFYGATQERGGKTPLVTKLTQVKVSGFDYETNKWKTSYGWRNANADGTVKAGLQKVGRATYFFSESGQMLSGWQSVEGKQYYFNLNAKTGRAPAVVNGIKIVKEQEYVYNSKTGTYSSKLVAKKYCFDKNGAAKLGWQQDAKKNWYYFQAWSPTSYSGAAALTNTTQWINGETYTFDKTGKLTKPKSPKKS